MAFRYSSSCGERETLSFLLTGRRFVLVKINFFSPLHVAGAFSCVNSLSRHQDRTTWCVVPARFSIQLRLFHDNQLGSAPWISPGAYNHHTPSAPSALWRQGRSTGSHRETVLLQIMLSFSLSGSVLNVDLPACYGVSAVGLSCVIITSRG